MLSSSFWDAAATALLLVLVLFAAWVVVQLRRQPGHITIFQYQAGLRFQNGKLVETLGPGRYSTFWPGTVITVEDMREQLLVISGQEMLTADNLAVKVSIAARHKTVDARQKALSAHSQLDLFYYDLQLALRKAVSSRPLEAVLADRNAIAQEVAAAAGDNAKARGVELLGVDVRDLMLSGETKRAYTDIFRAKKDGEAALERARGETAALRNLANGARLLNGNPALFNLRLLQTLTTSAGKGATVVLNTAGGSLLPMGDAATTGTTEPGERAP